MQMFISALYDDDTAPLPSDPRWYWKALEDMEHFTISPQVLSYLKQRNVLQETPIFFQQALKQKGQKAYFQNLWIKKKMNLIFDSFEQLQIPVIPLKGTHFIEKYFGHLSARWTSDIDLLIRPHDLNLAIHCIQSLGYSIAEEPIPSHFHLSFSQPSPRSSFSLTVELHWDLLQENTSQLPIEEFWAESEQLGTFTYVRELSDYHTFYMICLHGWRHQMNSLKYFLDILQTAKVIGPSLDWGRLCRDTQAHKTYHRIHKTLTIVNRHFPQLQPTEGFPLNSRYACWWEYQAIRDHSYKTYRQYFNLFCFEFLDFDSITDCLRKMIRWFFPSRPHIAYECGFPMSQDSLAIAYMKLYIQRFKKIPLLKQTKTL